MKKRTILLLALVLALSFTGCFAQEPESTQPETEEALEETMQIPSAQAPATVPTEPEYEQTITVDILIEGEPAQLTMELFNGGNYVIYIPQGEWALETVVENGLLIDHWSCTVAPEVFLEVISGGPLTQEEVLDRVRQAYPGEELTEYAPGKYTIGTHLDPYYRDLSFQSQDGATFALLTEMPVEFGDGFAPRFRAMQNSFEIR